MNYNVTGSALITVMLIMAISTILLVANIQTSQSRVALETSLSRSAVANELLFFAEGAALSHIQANLSEATEDSRNTVMNKLSTTNEPLLVHESERYPGWLYEVRLIDLQARININRTPYDTGYRNAIAALLAQHGAYNTDTISDWIDTDRDAQGIGAEDNAYSRSHEGYLTANQSMVSASEVSYIKDIPEGMWANIHHIVTALPQEARLNINTASTEVLDVMAPGVFFSDSVPREYANATLSTSSEFSGLPHLVDVFVTSSEYFELEITISKAPYIFITHSSLHVKPEDIDLIHRRPGFDLPIEKIFEVSHQKK